ncbi:hypothetical protein LOAG_18928 [Loa loa]|uniref:Uncharacterized protein n=1 Tax=Loa loa TaxID=7209 RepID=A0A1S0UDJ5_LOALO|nr:hypothetical protein LOAG_18928 [Loa loa]EJD73659.1 hypothetical protein LOAG_18928 [Loa loa]
MDIEEKHVREAYKYLASLPGIAYATRKSVIRWINVQKFVNQLPLGTIAVDIGNGKVLIYVWAFEQPNGKFPSQDVLVPCQLHHTNSISSNDHDKPIKFHMNSTREERLIRDSIAVNFLVENVTQTAHTPLFHRICNVFTSLHTLSRNLRSTLNGRTTKRYLSTLITGNLRCLMRHNAVERFSVEFTERIIKMALTEVLCIKLQCNSYRFYHVFKRDELKALIATTPSLRLVHLDYEHANWWAIAEKADSFS